NGDFVTVADNGWYLHRTAATGVVIANVIDVAAACYPPDQAGPPPWNLELWGVDFVGDDGIAVGGVVHQDGYVFRSTDAGLTWTLDSACYAHLLPAGAGKSPPTLYDVDLFGDPDGGVIVGYGSYTALGGTSASSIA